MPNVAIEDLAVHQLCAFAAWHKASNPFAGAARSCPSLEFLDRGHNHSLDIFCGLPRKRQTLSRRLRILLQIAIDSIDTPVKEVGGEHGISLRSFRFRVRSLHTVFLSIIGDSGVNSNHGDPKIFQHDLIKGKLSYKLHF